MKNSVVLFLILTIIFQFDLCSQTIESDRIDSVLLHNPERDSIRVDILNEASYKTYLIDLDQAFEYAKEANQISLEIDYLNGEARSYNLFGVCYDEKGDYSQALDNYFKAIEIYKTINNKEGLTQSYNNIGIVFRYQGNYQKALDFYYMSLKIDEELGNPNGISYSLNNIGIIYYYQNDYEKALEYFKRSLEIDLELGTKLGISNSYNNIGMIYEEQKEYSKALDYYMRSVEIKEELENRGGMATGYFNIGTIYMKLKVYEKADEYYQKALLNSIEVGKRSTETYSRIGMASLYLEKNDLDKACQMSKKAFQLANEIGDATLVKESAGVSAKCSYSIGRFQEAYDYHVIFKTMSDSLLNKEKIQRINDLENEYKYEQERKEAELAQQQQEAIYIEQVKRERFVRNALVIGFLLLFFLSILIFINLIQKRKANQILAVQKNEIKLKNEDLRIANATKDKFFAIIAHDLRSPFSALIGLSELLLIDNSDEKLREERLKLLNKSILNTFNLLENLLTWALAQSGRLNYSPKELSLKEILFETLFDLQEQASQKNIEVRNLIKMDEMIFADKDMISTVFRNIISNAIKFSHPGQMISISLNKSDLDGFCSISISDSGVGIPEDKIDDIFSVDKSTSTLGTNNEKGTGLGLILCKEFIEKHDGKIWVDSVVGEGTSFSFLLRKKSGVKN